MLRLPISPSGDGFQLQVLRLVAPSFPLPRMRSECHLVKATMEDVLWRHVDNVGPHARRDSDGLRPLIRTGGALLGGRHSCSAQRCGHWHVPVAL